MTWTEAGEYLITQKETDLAIDFESMLAIKPVDFTLLKPNWNWAGYFIQFIDIPVIGQVRIEEKINLSTKEPTLVIPRFYETNYQLKFYKADWIPQFKLIIYQNDMPLNYSPDAASINVPTSFASAALSATVPISATSVSFLAVNASRKKLIVANNSNQDLYIDFDATASAADHSVKIPKVTAGGFIATYELENYTGVVSGIWAAAGTGAALIREMVL
jgi:hypothetical protein